MIHPHICINIPISIYIYIYTVIHKAFYKLYMLIYTTQIWLIEICIDIYIYICSICSCSWSFFVFILILSLRCWLCESKISTNILKYYKTWFICFSSTIPKQVLCQTSETSAGGLWVYPGAAWTQGDQLAVCQRYDVRGELPALTDGDGLWWHK